MRKLLFIILAFVFIPFFVSAKGKDDPIPVLIRASAANVVGIEDGDFVSLFNDVVYNEIINNRVKLWDSFSKEIQLSGVTLQEIERNSSALFKEQKYIYVFENWKRTSKEIQSTTLGFLFTTKSKTGEDVSFGYVEYNELSAALQKVKLGVSADGYYNQTLALLLNTKKFAFDIIQFGGEVIKSSEDNDRIKAEFIGKLGFNVVLFNASEPQKMITYTIERSVQLNDELAENSTVFLDAIELYLINHPDKIAEFGNEELANKSIVDLKVNRVEIKELWVRNGDKLVYSPQQLVIYLNETPMKPMSNTRLQALSISFQGTDVFTYLKKKNFNFIINAINGQRISRSQSFFYLRALQEGDWRAINEYVKNM